MTRVKVCGITRPEDAELAVELGAWALGFILWAPSPRAADPAVAAGHTVYLTVSYTHLTLPTKA